MCIILKQACCGCTLRTGSLFIAILGLIGNIGEIITGVIVLIFEIDHRKGANRSGLIVDYFLWGSACVIYLIFNILLIVAIKQRRSYFVYLWLVETAAAQSALISFIIFCILNGAFLEAHLLLLAFGGILGIGLRWYFWSVVYSFYREMKFAEENPSVGLNTIS